MVAMLAPEEQSPLAGVHVSAHESSTTTSTVNENA